MPTKLDQEEKELLRSVERNEWKPVPNLKRVRTEFARVAKSTLRKDRRVNLRISTPDLEAIQVRAQEEGLPYQTLIASILHKYAHGRLLEK